MNSNDTNNLVTTIAEYHSNSDIRIKHIDRPDISDNEVLIKMKACGICGTDVMEWYRKKSAPRVLGHEMSGEIVKIGEQVDSFKLGDRVFVSHHVPCFDCYYCDNNKHSACNFLHTGNFFPGGFAEHISSIALFGLISILPSVVILAYFHGAPGKDEWTRVEKFGIPINILFIAIALFTGYKFNVWQDSPPDHSKVYDSFMVHVSSNQKNVDHLKLTDKNGINYFQKVGWDLLFPLGGLSRSIQFLHLD